MGRPPQDQYVWKVRWARPTLKDSRNKYFSSKARAEEFAKEKERAGTLLLFAQYQVKEVHFNAER